MSEPQDAAGKKRGLRLVPGIIIVSLQWIIRFVLPVIVPDALQIAVFAGLIGGLALAVWWLFFSRAPMLDRWGAFILVIAALVGTSFLLDVSIATANMGLMFILFSVPVVCLVFIVWAIAFGSLPDVPRRITMVAAILLASGFWICLRTDGMDAELNHAFAWRWAPTHEKRMLAKTGTESSALLPSGKATDTKVQWPGFRGAARDSIIRGVKIATNWTVSPPVLLWRSPVGPGCSSFAVQGDVFFTQEQLGDYEIVSCYNISNGKPVWQHRDKARFYDSHAGPGPRATPTLAGGRVYTLGGTGILNVLDAGSGKVLWSRNAAADAGIKALTWGFTGSPLVAGDLVIISLTGKLVAYDIASGKQKWAGANGGKSYSSPHPVTIDGIAQILLMSDSGVVSVEPVGGKQLWKYDWKSDDRILQPAVTGNDILLSADGEIGIRRIAVSNHNDSWSVKNIWNSSELKLNFNDFIIHKGYAYGFDGSSIACITVKDGRRVWKGNRYRGWLLLLADQDLLLVLSERGELALVPAIPDRFMESARIQAIKGKTWNHPVLAGDILLVRNAVEMAAFRLTLMKQDNQSVSKMSGK
ncbi:MAG: PQQ-like beta-propeller repeat protein [Spirochaetes bacterium]|nr:PQQ-like beta-propeller repeat protein [Spirochaetota bacterium]